MPGAIGGLELYACSQSVSFALAGVYQSHHLGQFPARRRKPHGVYGIESIMDDIAYKLGMDPVEFTLKNMLRPTAEQPFTNYSLDTCNSAGGWDTFDWQASPEK